MLHCDFCNLQVPKDAEKRISAETYITGTHKVIDGPVLVLESVGDWCACRECSKLIDADQWEDLVERVLRIENVAPYMVEPLRKHLNAFYANLRKHMLRKKGGAVN